MSTKYCKGKIYIIDNKRWCVGEKTSSKKYGNKIAKQPSKKKSKQPSKK